MSKILIGTASGHNVGFDLDLLLPTRLFIQADSGGGKSWFLRALCEQAFGKVQVIIVDPEGEFASLREKFPYVLVGKSGETPADPRSASLVAHKLLELQASAGCDLYELKSHLRHAWVKNFLEALDQRPKDLVCSCLVIVDEAHMFCPEKGKGESEAYSTMVDLCTRGRKRGLCAVFATQRLGILSKDASNQLQNRLIGPTFEDINRKRAAEVLGILKSDEREFFHQIQLLELGNFFAIGRAISHDRILVKIREVETSHPKAFQKHQAPAPPTPDKIKALLPKLADLPKEAEEKARTEAELRQEIRSLKAALANAAKQEPTAAPDPKVIERQVKAAVSAATEPLVKQLRQVKQMAAKIASPARLGALDLILKDLKNLASFPAPESEPQAPRPAAALRVVSPPPAPSPASTLLAAVGTNGNAHLSGPQTALLRRLAEFRALGCVAGNLTWLASTLGTTMRSRGFEENMRVLRSTGLVASSGGQVQITTAGIEIIGEQTSTSCDELHASVKRMLCGPQAELLSTLENIYPDACSLEDLASRFNTTVRDRGFEENLRVYA